MQIGQVIRKYRKESGLTQDEMASRLGVTAPAVNKWEKGVSYPDIMLLAPIARLLNISLDMLLSFQEELTTEEIMSIVKEADKRFKTDAYKDVFQWAKSQIEEFPNCKMLIWQLATILDAQRLIKEVEASEQYDSFILQCYERVLESEDEKLRTGAADSLFGYYLRKEQYDKAENYLSYYSEQNPERKRKQAVIFSETGKREEAYKSYEELLFSGYQTLSMVFHCIYMMAMQDEDMDKAGLMVEKQQALASLFDMGVYHEASCGLELATAQKDIEAVVEIMEKMLIGIENITDFTESELYEHMTFKKSEGSFIDELKENLLKCFRDEETYGFLKENERYKKLMDRK